eukprot:gene2481-2430_t
MTIDIRLLGRVDYASTVQAMQDYTATRTPSDPDTLWICEHPPLYTQGIAGKSDHVLDPGEIPVIATNRGGQVTFHGPGQVVAYPLIDLQRAGYFVKEYVYRVEEAVIRTLAHFGITGHRVAGAPGIYVRLDDPHSHAMLPQRPQKRTGAEAPTPDFEGLGKIAALGIKVSRHCTYHGVALNVDMDLEPYDRINPCGYAGLKTVDLSTIGVHTTWEEAAQVLGQQLSIRTPEVVREAQSTEAYNPLAKQKAAAKLSRIPIKVEQGEVIKKPEWIRVKAGSPTTRFYEIKEILREHKLHTVCEEASCPNIGECFGKGTATFMIMGDKCTRRCPFCDVGHGRPDPLDKDEPLNLAKTIAALKLKYVVITSVDRDDLRDGGSGHFVECIQNIRELSPQTQIEILVPDFRGRDDRALEILKAAPPDVMNHNLETAPRLYKEARPGSDYQFSLNLLKKFKALHPNVPTKSGIMVGLGETDEEILQVMRDMREHNIDMLTIGQYLAPSNSHLPVRRYVHPDTFKMFEEEAYKMGFSHAAVGAMVRSSYHADQQAHAAGV